MKSHPEDPRPETPATLKVSFGSRMPLCVEDVTPVDQDGPCVTGVLRNAEWKMEDDRGFWTVLVHLLSLRVS